MIHPIRYMRPQWKQTSFALGFAALTQLLTLAEPLIFQCMVDWYATKMQQFSLAQFLTGIGLLTLAAIGVAACARASHCLQYYTVSRISQQTGTAIFTDGIEHIFRLPLLTIEDHSSGELLEKLQKARRDVERFIPAAVNLAFTSVVGVVFVIVYASRVHWSIIPVYLLLVPTLVWLNVLISRRMAHLQTRISRRTTSLSGAAVQSVRNIHTVKALGIAAHEIARINASAAELQELERQRTLTLSRFVVLQSTLVNAARVATVVLVSWLLFKGAVSFGQFVSLFIYSFYIFGPLQEVGYIAGVFREMKTSLDEWDSIRHVSRESRGELATPELLENLSFSEVCFEYPASSVPALQRVSFSVKTGEVIAFVGPSGAGKTTLVRLITGVNLATRGEVAWNGISNGQLNLDALRQRIGYVSQNTELFAGTIGANLRLACEGVTDDDCLAALRNASLSPLLERLKDGLNTPVGEGGVKLSGGERQRLAIARALLRSPDVLILDEATSALDPLTERDIIDAIRNMASTQCMLTVLISHRLAAVSFADRIYVLDSGRIAESGNHRALLNRRGLYHRMWVKQASLEFRTGSATRMGFVSAIEVDDPKFPVSAFVPAGITRVFPE